MIQSVAREQCYTYKHRFEGLSPEEAAWHLHFEELFDTVKLISIAIILPCFALAVFRKQIMTHPNEIIIFALMTDMASVASIRSFFDYCNTDSWHFELLTRSLSFFGWQDTADDKQTLQGALVYLYIMFLKHTLEFAVIMISIVYAWDLIITIRNPLADLHSRTRLSLQLVIVISTLFFFYSLMVFISNASTGKSMGLLYYQFIGPVEVLNTVCSICSCVYAIKCAITGVYLRKGFNQQI